jgi:hypothetical protein
VLFLNKGLIGWLAERVEQGKLSNYQLRSLLSIAKDDMLLELIQSSLSIRDFSIVEIAL